MEETLLDLCCECEKDGYLCMNWDLVDELEGVVDYLVELGLVCWQKCWVPNVGV